MNKILKRIATDVKLANIEDFYSKLYNKVNDELEPTHEEYDKLRKEIFNSYNYDGLVILIKAKDSIIKDMAFKDLDEFEEYFTDADLYDKICDNDTFETFKKDIDKDVKYIIKKKTENIEMNSYDNEFSYVSNL